MVDSYHLFQISHPDETQLKKLARVLLLLSQKVTEEILPLQF